MKTLLKRLRNSKIATIEKWMGYDVKNIDDEDEMVVAMKAIKAKLPHIFT